MTETPELSRTPATVDLDAFIALHHRRLLGLLTLKTGSRDEAEDLAQDALIKLVAHWAEVAEMANPWGWLATVAINSSSSSWRRKIRGRAATARLAALGSPQQDDSGAVEMLSVVQTLPARQREALILRFYAQLSVRETAQAMGCAEGTVKSLTHNAIGQLRTELQEEIDDED